MRTHNRDIDSQGVVRQLATQTRTRMADWHNLPKPRWRDALAALARPAERVHAYRNLRTRAMDAAMAATYRVDCR